MPKVFVSHSHEDKSIARRIVRFLHSFGVDAWLDERELRLGSRLDGTIRNAIRESDAVVVVATHAAARSQWVEREVAFANDSTPAVAVLPVYVDEVMAHPSFAPHYGIQARDRYQFADVLAQLAEALVGCPLPQPDAGKLEVSLEELSHQSSGVALLVESCLRGKGLLREHVQLVSEVSFHDLDDALDSISRLGGNSAAAQATAALFARRGAGSAALSRYIAGGHNVLRSAVGVELHPTMLDTAIRLLSVAAPPDDQALASFLEKNSNSLAGRYRADVVRLITHPDRGPARFGADAAGAAFRVLPEDDDLVLLWSRWIIQGLFDQQETWIIKELFDGQEKRGAARPRAFAHWCGQGLRTGSAGWSRVFDVFIRHVRELARAKSKQAVDSALQHLVSAADENNPRVSEIAEACQSALGAAEWDGWDESDEMSFYVEEFAAEALGERNWGEARRRAAEAWGEFQIALRRAISQRESLEQH